MESTQPKETPKSNAYLVIIVLAVLVFVVFGIVLTSQKNSQQFSKVIPSQKPPSPTVKPTRGSLSLINKTVAVKFPVNKPVVLDVIADSDNEDISGFDILVKYDKNEFEFVKTASSSINFIIFPFVKPDFVSITATKSLQSKTPETFKNTAIMEITFTPKKVGSYSLSLASEIGKESTKFVNTQTEVFYPKLNNITLEIY